MSIEEMDGEDEDANGSGDHSSFVLYLLDEADSSEEQKMSRG
jgi:hypothetical protein